jgi:adsorption protein B
LTGDGEDDASPALADATAARGVPLLGDIMIEMGLVTRSAFEAALRDYRPERHGRIGDYMVAEAIITSDALTAAVAEQRRRYLARAGIR